MALVPTTVGDLPETPFSYATVYNPDQLIAGDFKLVTEGQATITGGALLVRGTVLGKITLGAASSAAKGGGNTGNGTFVLDVATPILANAKAGVYTLRCVIAIANGGQFVLLDPNGNQVGVYIIVAGAGGTIAIADQIKGVLTDGGNDFIVGDGFDITIAAGSGSYKAAVATAVDGSQYPVAILADNADASGGDVNGGLYLTGEFNQTRLTFDNSFTLATLKTLLRPWSIFLKTALGNAAPT